MSNYHYKISPNIRLIEEFYSGQIGIDFINQCLEKMSSDKDFDPSFDIIVDFSAAHFDESCKNAAMLKQAVESHDQTYVASWSKTAIIVDSPFNTACVTLFRNRSVTRNIEVFCTREAAERWMGLSEARYRERVTQSS